MLLRANVEGKFTILGMFFDCSGITPCSKQAHMYLKAGIHTFMLLS